MDIRDREQALTLPVYPQLDLEPVAASGVHIVTRDNRRILDLYGGHAVASLGYGHPALTKAVADQTERMVFQSNALALESRIVAAEKLVNFSPDYIQRVFFCNSGGEANENALRIAFMLSGRQKVIAVEHGFHGRTAAAASVTFGSQKRWYGFPRTPFDVVFVPRNDVQALEAAMDETVAAVIVEPVQGIAGAFDFEPAFMRALATTAKNAGALFIADEVQCGMGRAGAAFALERYGVAADIITTAKALGGGFPCAALLTNNDIAAQLKHGDLGTTFGGGPVVSRAIAAVIDTILGENLLTNVREREAQIRAQCIVGPVKSVSGMGLLIGLHVEGKASDLRDALLERDILTGTSADPAVLRLLPPLTLGAEHIDQLATELARI